MFPHYRQLDQMDCGPTCLRMIAKHYGKYYTAQTLREKCGIGRDGVSMLAISEAAEVLGFKTVGLRLNTKKLIEEAPLPCILHWGQNHFVVLTDVLNKTGNKAFLGEIWGGRKPSIDPRALHDFSYHLPTDPVASQKKDGRIVNAKFVIADPANEISTLTLSEFEEKWLSSGAEIQQHGIALILEPTQAFYENQEETFKSIKFGQILNYLWIYRPLLVQLFIGMFVGSGLALLVPFLTQSLVDVGIGTQNLPFIYLIIIAQIVLMISTSSVNFIRSWILLHISSRLNVSILSEFLSKLLRLPVSFFDSKQFGDIMQRIGDHQRIESFLTGQALNILFSITNFLVFGFLLAWYNLSIFIVAIGASVVYMVWISVFLKRRRRLDSKRFDILSKNQSQIVQLITGIHDIKLAGAETSKRWEWEGTQAQLFKWNIKNLSLSQFQQAGTLLINDGKNIFITFLAAKAVMDGQLSLGAMMSIQYILGQFNVPLEQMLSVLQAWQDAQMSLERLNEVHALKTEDTEEHRTRFNWSDSADIKFRNVKYTYPGAGNEPVIKDLNLLIPYGKTTAIVGSSGSGKTTILKLLLRFYEPDSGSVYLNHKKSSRNLIVDEGESTLDETGIKLSNVSMRAWRRGCGVVMQDGFMFSDTIARNIAVGDEILDGERLRHAAEVANIHLFIDSLPLGYETRIGAEGNGLSQGQKQRILIARAVYKNPHLLLFDEATNALDASNESIILRNLAKCFSGKTVVVVAHRLSTVKNADQIIVLEKGKIVEAGNHNQLIALKGKYFELVSNQLNIGIG